MFFKKKQIKGTYNVLVEENRHSDAVYVTITTAEGYGVCDRYFLMEWGRLPNRKEIDRFVKKRILSYENDKTTVGKDSYSFTIGGENA